MNLVVFIIGTTASGKTKLSLNLSNSDNYEIISCDSMQIYKGADIMTAKATKAEQSKVPHHCLDLIDLDSVGFNRTEWVAIVRQLIKDIQARGKVPVVVGGTTYYLEPLLFRTAERTQGSKHQLEEGNLLQQLKDIDPIAAQKYHENDHRRIRNALQYYHSTGELPSSIPDFHSEENTILLDNYLLLWPRWSSKERLRNKVATRISQMLREEGGLDEIMTIFNKLKDAQQGLGGVLQSIGYRQFSEVYDLVKDDLTKLSSESAKAAIRASEAKLIADTNHYTKKQLQWIKNRILQNPNIHQMKSKLCIFEFDEESQFLERVIKPAQLVFQAAIEGRALDDFKLYQLSEEKIEKYRTLGAQKERNNWKKQTCELCSKELNGPMEWQQHIKSKQHTINKRRNDKQDLTESDLQKKALRLN